MQSKYEQERQLVDFHIAAFAYCDGLDVIGDLKLGAEVSLRCEPDNPHDPNAVAIYRGNTKIGYVPNGKNDVICKFLYFGHEDIFEARISMVALDQHPERQFRVTVKIADHRIYG